MIAAALLLALQSPAAALADLPLEPEAGPGPAAYDWLVDPVPRGAGVFRGGDGKELVLENGLVRRAWRLAPNGACVGLDELTGGRAVLRAVRPEARVVIEGLAFDVGGLTGPPNHAYLDPRWLDAMEADPRALQLTGFAVLEPEERLVWKRARHHAPGVHWPPRGVGLRLDFAVPALEPRELLSLAVDLSLIHI